MNKRLLIVLFLVWPLICSANKFMENDADHKKMEEKRLAATENAIQQMARQTILTWIIAPKFRLSKDDIKALNDKSLPVDGKWTQGSYTVIGDKQHLAFSWNNKDNQVSANQSSTEDDKKFFDDEADLLLEKGFYNELANAYDFVFRWPGDSQKEKKIIVRLSNINVKNPDTPLGKFIINEITNPYIERRVAPAAPTKKKNKVTQEQPPVTGSSSQPSTAAAQPQTVYVPVPTPAPAPPSSTIIIEEPYYHRPYLYPPIIIDGYHHHHRW